MLRVKSFSIEDDKGINELMDKYQLAKGMHILVSGSTVCIPYEDGEPTTNEQRKNGFMEQLNEKVDKLDVIIHAKELLERKAKGINESIADLENGLITAPKGKADYDHNKTSESEIKRLHNVLDQTNSSILLNQAELTNTVTEIEVYKDKIKSLE